MGYIICVCDEATSERKCETCINLRRIKPRKTMYSDRWKFRHKYAEYKNRREIKVEPYTS